MKTDLGQQWRHSVETQEVELQCVTTLSRGHNSNQEFEDREQFISEQDQKAAVLGTQQNLNHFQFTIFIMYSKFIKFYNNDST